jgi:four helix bundle protein
MRITQYEDLDAWKCATDLKRRVIELTSHERVRTDFRFCDQIRSSTASITANIAEGFGRFTDPELLRYLRYARGSAFETREWLRDGRDRGHFSEASFEEVWSLLERVTKTLTGLAATVDRRVQRRKRRGPLTADPDP